jgi:aspartate 1-decarboxylase
MLRTMCRAKIHRARVTATRLDYEGSLTLDKTLMDAAGLLPFELVQVVNVNNGTRAETYLIEGEADSGDVCVNGALARWAQPNDLIIIMAFAQLDEKELGGFAPRLLHVDENNRIVNDL